jgi:phosphatidylglycerophosphatase A
MTAFAIAIATALGAGFAPAAPGTFGSAVGLVLWWALPASPVVQAVAIVLIFILGSWSGSVAEHYFKKSDPGQVVIDEVLGQMMTMWINPVAGWVGVLLGFGLFRLMDITKPWPARQLEALHGGVGIMADDAMAGVYANLALRAVLVGAGAMQFPL